MTEGVLLQKSIYFLKKTLRDYNTEKSLQPKDISCDKFYFQTKESMFINKYASEIEEIIFLNKDKYDIEWLKSLIKMFHHVNYSKVDTKEEDLIIPIEKFLEKWERNFFGFSKIQSDVFIIFKDHPKMPHNRNKAKI
jgi:hypothetical protein